MYNRYCLMKKAILFAVLLLGNLVLAAQQTSMDALKADYPQLMKKFGKELEGQRADYIFAIDVSGTMNKYRETVVPALGEFFKSLQEGDYVSIIKFGGEATNALVPAFCGFCTNGDHPQQVVRGVGEEFLRRLGETADEINKMVGEGSGEADALLEAAERKIYALRQGRNVGGLLPISGIVQNVFDNLSEAAASGNKIPGIPTGLADLDRTILGLNKSELILVAARPGMGKTSIALNMALHAAVNEGKTIAIFSLEMSREQLVSRLLSKAALIPSQNLLTGQLTPQQWRNITDAAQTLSATDIRIDDNPSLTVSEMNAQCRRIPKLDLVIIDYLQLMQSAGSGHSWSNESRTQAVSDISRMMKIMAKELNVPVICLSQLSRANESRQDKRPMLSDLRESGAIEQDADVVIGLYRDGYYNKECENPNLAEAIILKNRKGATGTVELTWLPEYTSFGNVERWHEDDY